jgi:hypothetical protein
MNKCIELANYGASGYCILNIETNEVVFAKYPIYKGIFTGLYFKDDNNFFAIYPTKNGPIVYYKEREYEINPHLIISLTKDGKNRKFCIKEYNIEIDYMESPYIGFDNWSDEIDVVVCKY